MSTLTQRDKDYAQNNYKKLLEQAKLQKKLRSHVRRHWNSSTGELDTGLKLEYLKYGYCGSNGSFNTGGSLLGMEIRAQHLFECGLLDESAALIHYIPDVAVYERSAPSSSPPEGTDQSTTTTSAGYANGAVKVHVRWDVAVAMWGLEGANKLSQVKKMCHWTAHLLFARQTYTYPTQQAPWECVPQWHWVTDYLHHMGYRGLPSPHIRGLLEVHPPNPLQSTLSRKEQAARNEALVASAGEGNVAQVTMLARAGCEVNYAAEPLSGPLVGVKAPNGTALTKNAPPIIAAALNGKTEMIVALVQLGADVNNQLEDGGTAALIAASNGHQDTVEALAYLGADLYKGGGRIDGTPMVAACKNGDVALVKLLAELGVSVDPPPSHQLSPMHIALEGGHLAAVRMLLTLGADPNHVVPGINACTPLMAAAMNGQDEAIGALVAAGAHVNFVGGMQGLSALLIAIYSKKVKCVEALLQAGADVSITMQVILGSDNIYLQSKLGSM